MAPPKPGTRRERIDACAGLLALLNSASPFKADDRLLAQLSVVKGMFNRIAREDQWDWFTVSGQLGYPSSRLAKAIAYEINHLRTALVTIDVAETSSARISLLKMPVRRCLSVFLGLTRIVDEPDAGWVYILSTREMNDLLKIGMTTRTVEMRAQEINGATGVAIPFGVRRCWRVLEPRRAEKLVHQALDAYRLRNDRELFRMDFIVAAQRTHNAIQLANLEIRTLDAFASLAQD
jgi:hypothetical protein